MPLSEYVGNLHMHTPYSDGELSHAAIATVAMRAGLDFIIVTDHNVWVQGPEHYYEEAGQRVLMLVGEEVHDQTRIPQKNHLLVYNTDRELAPYARDPQVLLDTAREVGALTFLAHPFDPPMPALKELGLEWANWEVTGYTGLEIWNYMTEFKGLITSYVAAFRYAFYPEQGIRGPAPETLAKWDELTAAGQRVVAIGNSDAHGTEYGLFGVRRVIFPYEFLFKQVNTHVLTETAFTGDYAHDKRLVLDALTKGHCFVAYDALGSPKGFRFSVNHDRGVAIMGDEVFNKSGITLQIAVPARARLRLIQNGKVIVEHADQTHITHIAQAGEAGVFRVEAHLMFKGQWRGWIYSNPIYVRG